MMTELEVAKVLIRMTNDTNDNNERVYKLIAAIQTPYQTVIYSADDLNDIREKYYSLISEYGLDSLGIWNESVKDYDSTYLYPIVECEDEIAILERASMDTHTVGEYTLKVLDVKVVEPQQLKYRHPSSWTMLNRIYVTDKGTFFMSHKHFEDFPIDLEEITVSCENSTSGNEYQWIV